MNDRNLLKMLLCAVEGRYFGKYRARVSNNQDPLNRGRIEVIVDNVLNENPVWALPCVPYAGPDVGMLFLPDVDTHVWVEFEGGNLCMPIWTGCFWKDGELAPGTMPNRRFIKTKEFTLEIDDEAGTLTLKANTGGAQIVITRNEVKVEAANNVTSTVGGRKTTLNIRKFDVNNGAFEVT